MDQSIVIRSESDAWNLLEAVLEGGFDDHSDISINFEGWPNLEVEVKSGEAMISPTLMTGFISLQQAIYRSYALITYETTNIGKLSEEEKEALEFSVRVSKGSSNFNLDLQEIAQDFCKRAVGKMESKHILIVALTTIVAVAGYSSFSIYMENQKEIRIEELRSKEKKELLQSQVFLSQQETKRMEVLAKAIGKDKSLPIISGEANNAKQNIIKSIGKTSDASIGDTHVDQEVAKELAKNPRKTATDVRVSGTFKILKVDTTVRDGFRVKVHRLTDGLELTAGLLDIMISAEQKELIKNTEWAKGEIYLEIDAKLKGELYTDATIKIARKAEG